MQKLTPFQAVLWTAVMAAAVPVVIPPTLPVIGTRKRKSIIRVSKAYMRFLITSWDILDIGLCVSV